MKRQLVIIVAVIAALTAIFLLRQKRTATGSRETIVPTETNTPPEVQADKTRGSDRPSPLAIPIEAAKRLAAEQRWASRNNGPVAFYAKVVDQNGQPVQGATLTLNLSIFDEGLLVNDKDRVKTTKLTIMSDAQGLWEFKRDKGSSLWVENIEKDGYLWQMPRGLGSFAFGPLNAPKIPQDYTNPNKRLVFHMWKKGRVEPVVSLSLRIPIGSGRPDETSIDLLIGKTGLTADLIVKTPHVAGGAEKGERNFIFEVPDGGIIESQDVYPYTAPPEGYQAKWEWLFQPANAVWGAEGWRRNFYLKARGGKLYAGMSVVFDFSGPAFVVEIVTNPAGSRNLEPDPEKLITDPKEIRRWDEQTRSGK